MGVAEDLAKLELDLRELIIKYEQYFFGIEKREPLRMLDTVERAVRRYQNVSIPNTSQRFKYESLVSSLSVHKQKWARTNRLIEEGKFQRDRFRMSLHQAEQAERKQKGASRPDSSPSQDNQIESVYQQYVSARLACNLPVENVTREKLAEAINRQKPALMEKYGCRDVDFVVVVEGGKPSLKARPKNS